MTERHHHGGFPLPTIEEIRSHYNRGMYDDQASRAIGVLLEELARVR